jgi:hypothetical protein
MLGVTFEYALQALLLAIRAWIQGDWFPEQHEMVYLVSESLVWAVQLGFLVETKFPVWYPYYVNWLLAVLFEIVLSVVAMASILPFRETFEIVSVSIHGVRLGNIVLLPSVSLVLRNRKPRPIDPEREALLGTTEATSNTADDDLDSIVDEDDPHLKREREDKERAAKRLELNGNWWTYTKAFMIFLPYIWPKHSKKLQLRMMLVWACILAGNLLNVLVPRQLGVVVDAVTTARVSREGQRTWIAVAVFVALTFARSDACIGWLHWAIHQPIEQYQYAALNNAALSHVMSLSSDYHEKKEPSQIYMAVFRGRAVTGLLDIILYKLVPMFIDLLFVFLYLYYLFGAYMGLILAVTTISYLHWTASLMARAQKQRRPYVYYYGREWRAAYRNLGTWTMASVG